MTPAVVPAPPTATAEADRLRAFWNARYRRFTLDESGWAGAGDALNARIYACKAAALRASLSAAGWLSADSCTVLDAGCGQGYFASLYRHHYPAWRYVGVDLSAAAVAHLRSHQPAAEFHDGDLSTWRDPGSRLFDVVQAIDVLHLILDDDVVEGAMANLAGHLRAGGTLLMTAALPERTVQPGDYLRYRSCAFWKDLWSRLRLRVEDSRRMYYWLPSGGPANKYLRYGLSRLGAPALFAIDRAALALGAPQPRSAGIDSQMKLLTLRTDTA
jgi:SAM-dependent methyltransferase